MIAKTNGLGTLRLVLAGLVIISHSWELLELPEPLRALGSRLSFGDIAVDGFFVLSGYLVASSWVSSPDGYFWRRAKRIFPGFVVCYALCILIAPLWTSAPIDWPRTILRMVTLKFPLIGDMTTNGSVWTIVYEFRCYLLVMALGLLGVFRKPSILLALAVVCLVGSAVLPSDATLPLIETVFGDAQKLARLCGAFLVGSAFRFVPGLLTPWLGLALVAVPIIGEPALVIGGGALMMWLGFKGKSPKEDVSYGLYLYGWPVGMLLILAGISNPFALVALTLIASLLCGWASWRLIERPAMRLVVPRVPALRRPVAG